MISRGECSVIINASGLSSSHWTNGPKLTHKLNEPFGVSILEFYLRRLKGVGKLALRKHGKNFSDNREPIMVIIMTNEKDTEKI